MNAADNRYYSNEENKHTLTHTHTHQIWRPYSNNCNGGIRARYELCGGFPEEIKERHVVKTLEMCREGGRGRDPSPPKNSGVATQIYIDSNYFTPPHSPTFPSIFHHHGTVTFNNCYDVISQSIRS